MKRIIQQQPLVTPEINSDVTIQMTASIVGKHFDIQADEKLQSNLFKEIAMMAAVVIARVLNIIGQIFLLIPPQAGALMSVGLQIIYIIAYRKALQTRLKIGSNREEVTQKEEKKWYYIIESTIVFMSVMIVCEAVYFWSKLY